MYVPPPPPKLPENQGYVPLPSSRITPPVAEMIFSSPRPSSRPPGREGGILGGVFHGGVAGVGERRVGAATDFGDRHRVGIAARVERGRIALA